MTRKNRSYGRGWYGESGRHYLARHGIETAEGCKKPTKSRGRSELISEEELREWQPQKKHINAVEDVLAWESVVDTIEPIVESYKKDVLREHDFHVSDEFSDVVDFDVIRNPADVDLMSDEDYEKYRKLVEEAEDEHGFDELPDDYDPLLVAESGLRNAKNKLGHRMGKVVGIDYDDLTLVRHKEKLTDTSIKYLIKEINPKDMDEKGRKYLNKIYEGETNVGDE